MRWRGLRSLSSIKSSISKNVSSSKRLSECSPHVSSYMLWWLNSQSPRIYVMWSMVGGHPLRFWTLLSLNGCLWQICFQANNWTLLDENHSCLAISFWISCTGCVLDNDVKLHTTMVGCLTWEKDWMKLMYIW